MTKIIGVRFRTAGKVYYFDPKNMEIRRGQHVIVETSRGVEYGHVVVGTREVAKEEVVQPLKPVIRITTPEDDERVRRNREKEREAMKICREKIQKHNLEMKLIDAEYTFDNNKILFYFTADGRVDFRELVKDLAVVFKMRIELRQIGVRDETKILGSVGICGRPLCCHTFLSDFAPVSIKMAKEQNLSLNPAKISGVCGRLMCCLKNEQETYEYLNSRMPRRGDQVTMEDGRTGSVHSVNVLRQTVRVLIEENDEKEILELPVAELTFLPRKKKGANREREANRESENGQQEKDGSGEESGRERNKNRSRRQEREKNREQGGKDRDRKREPEQKIREKDRSTGSDRIELTNPEREGEPAGERERNSGRRGNRNSSRERRQTQTQEQNEPRNDAQNSRQEDRSGNEAQGEPREHVQNQRRGSRERNRRQESEGESQREEHRRDSRNRRRDRGRNRSRDGQAENRQQEENRSPAEKHADEARMIPSENGSEGEERRQAGSSEQK